MHPAGTNLHDETLPALHPQVLKQGVGPEDHIGARAPDGPVSDGDAVDLTGAVDVADDRAREHVAAEVDRDPRRNGVEAAGEVGGQSVVRRQRPRAPLG